MRRIDWNLFAWLLLLSAVFWAAVAMRSCGDGPPRSLELER
jgi:hypothetical protein